MKADGDYILARESASGSRDAQEQIFNAHRRRVYCLCLKIVENPETAEDLTQDVFIQVFKTIGKFRGDAKLATWIHRLAVNQCLMYLRRHKKKFAAESISETEEFSALDIEDEKASPARLEAKLLIENCLRLLPQGYRAALVLHDIEGFEHREIAGILGISEGTSKSQAWKAREKMRKLLNRRANPRLSFLAAN